MMWVIHTHLTLLDAAPGSGLSLVALTLAALAPWPGLSPTLTARLVIMVPASATPGLSRSLPALVDLARQTNCAILLPRSLHQSPADPFPSPGPSSPLLQAARSRLLLAPDPTDDGPSSSSPPNIPSARSQASWLMTFSPLKQASPPSTVWLNA